MDNNTNVPYIVFEGEQARSERQIKRLFIALVITIVLLFASNAFWLYEWTQYDYVPTETEYVQDGEGTNVIGTGNEVLYGTEVSHKN